MKMSKISILFFCLLVSDRTQCEVRSRLLAPLQDHVAFNSVHQLYLNFTTFSHSVVFNLLIFLFFCSLCMFEQAQMIFMSKRRDGVAAGSEGQIHRWAD